MTDDPTHPPAAPATAATHASRRGFLMVAGAAAATAAAATIGCAPGAESDSTPSAATGTRATGFDRPMLDALADVMLPASIGAAARSAAVRDFVAWVDGYDPVAEQQHGYGYAEIRYLPPDPAPGWRAQLTGLDVLGRKMHRRPFVELDAGQRQEVVAMALAPIRETNMPDPLGAAHVAIALVAHWAGTPAANDLALGVSVGTGTCRPLAAATGKPLPIVGARTGVQI